MMELDTRDLAVMCSIFCIIALAGLNVWMINRYRQLQDKYTIKNMKLIELENEVKRRLTECVKESKSTLEAKGKDHHTPSSTFIPVEWLEDELPTVAPAHIENLTSQSFEIKTKTDNKW